MRLTRPSLIRSHAQSSIENFNGNVKRNAQEESRGGKKKPKKNGNEGLQSKSERKKSDNGGREACPLAG
jgi:hypothetical protein